MTMTNADETPLAVFAATIDENDGSAVIRIPAREIDLDTVSVGEGYRVALFDSHDRRRASPDHSTERDRPRYGSTASPVDEGDQLEVEIEDVGEQGDGIARVGPGYVVFVPEADIGDRVTIEVTKTRGNFGFADVVTPEPITD